MTNRIIQLFERKPQGILNIYFTAGFPRLGDTIPILEALEEAGVDMVEIGIPFSDPVADGPTIQQSNDLALANGMRMKLLFEQLEGVRAKVNVPILLMGYLNPVMQFGVAAFTARCREVGVDGVILPDLPLAEYLEDYQAIFEQHNLLNIFLVTPQTTEDRIRQLDAASRGFIYLVSSASITGNALAIQAAQEAYFARVKAMQLRNPTLIGFGITDHASFSRASQYANGAIIGSAFIKELQRQQSEDLTAAIHAFVRRIRGEAVLDSVHGTVTG